jgi:hypothetical protein
MPAMMSVAFYIDTNGNEMLDDGEPAFFPPPTTLTSSCPQALVPAAVAMLDVLADGGSFVEPGGLGGGVIIIPHAASAPGGPGSDSGLTTSQRARLRAAEKVLRHGVIRYVNDGQWTGHFSNVARRLDAVVRFIRDIPGTEDVVGKLECASLILQHNPDVRSIVPDFPGRRGRTARIAADFSAAVPVLNLGRRNKPIPPDEFTPCMQPAVESVSVRGRGEAIPGPGLQVTYTATGRGIARLTTAVEYAPELVTVIMEEGEEPPGPIMVAGGVSGAVGVGPLPPGPIIIHVPADLVYGDGADLGMEFSFKKKGKFCLRQK